MSQPNYKPKILLVEDHPVILELLRLFLSRSGFEVATAAAGEQALLAIQQQPADLALIDLELPDINGIRLIPLIRRSKEDFPIVILSGHDLSHQLQLEALQAGAAAFLPKSIGLENIVSAVKSILRFER